MIKNLLPKFGGSVITPTGWVGNFYGHMYYEWSSSIGSFLQKFNWVTSDRILNTGNANGACTCVG